MTEYDVLVVGAGAGGLFTAARLSKQGYRVLVVERLGQVGGRASTHDIDGFKVNNGAIVIELGGITQQTFEEVGAEFDVREPSTPILYRIKGKDVDVAKGGWGFLLSQLTRQAAKIATGIGAARKDDEALPEHQMTTAEWVAKFTTNESVHGIFHNMCGSVFAVGSDELPARVFLTYFTRKSAFKRFGFCPDGTIGIWKSLAGAVEAHGGTVQLDTEVTALHVADGLVTGATLRRDGVDTDITCRVAVSDAGPAATAELVGSSHLPESYLAEVKRADRPCSMISINFASRTPLLDAPGMLSFAKTRRLCYVANFTQLCPEMAPEGWHLYVGTAVPKPAVGDFDEAAETALLLEDLHEQIPGFAEARILNTAITRDGWPPQRAVAGFDVPNTTPIPNLWNVGDGVKEYANGGTTACAETAQLVATSVASYLGRPS